MSGNWVSVMFTCINIYVYIHVRFYLWSIGERYQIRQMLRIIIFIKNKSFVCLCAQILVDRLAGKLLSWFQLRGSDVYKLRRQASFAAGVWATKVVIGGFVSRKLCKPPMCFRVLPKQTSQKLLSDFLIFDNTRVFTEITAFVVSDWHTFP